MFRKMRRFKQQLTGEECAEILRRERRGVLAVLGDGGYPYALPLDFVYEDGKIYFHCATKRRSASRSAATPCRGSGG